MKFDTALRHYRSVSEIARICDVTHQAVYHWKRDGVIPYRKALVMQEDSKGAIEIDGSVYGQVRRKTASGGKSRA